MKRSARLAAPLAISLGLLTACASLEPRADGRTAAARTDSDVRVVATRSSSALRMTAGDYHCRTPGYDGGNTYPLCKDIPIIVLLVEPSVHPSGCVAVMPYYALRIHRRGDGGAGNNLHIEWKLHGPTGYVFDASNGIYPTGNSSNGQQWDYIYVDRQAIASGEKFRWRIRQNPPSSESFGTRMIVRNPGGVACDEDDPHVINEAN